jgi:cell wall-associated NlpC family hydrolase
MFALGGTVASTSNGVSGVSVTVLAAGALFIWSGIQNRDVIGVLRELIRGQKPISGKQSFSRSHVGGGTVPSSGGGNSAIVSTAATYKGHPYIFGGGHGEVCPSGGMDCSGFVSCVLNKVGAMKGTLTTDGFAKWGTSVPFADRQPGDIVVWIRGPGNGHMGIIIDDKTMWHTPCTGCGGVQVASYGSTRDTHPTIVRRAPVARRVP